MLPSSDVVSTAALTMYSPSRCGSITSLCVSGFSADTSSCKGSSAPALSFNPSRDGGYNKRVREMLSEIRFRPAVRADGRPVRDTALITAIAP